MSVATSSHERTRARHLGPERRRPQVLDAARSLAVEQGLGAVTMAALADRLGVTRPVIYACFDDRVHVVVAMLAREEQRLLAAVFAAYPPPGRYASTKRAFVGGFQALLTTVAAEPDTWRALFFAQPDPDVSHLFGRARAAVAERFADLIRPELATWGTVDAERKLPALVELFMSAGEGAVRTLLNEPGTWTPEELAAVIGAATYRAIRGA